jgi:hypothetical protein
MSKDRRMNQPKFATFLNPATMRTASGDSSQQSSTPPVFKAREQSCVNQLRFKRSSFTLQRRVTAFPT